MNKKNLILAAANPQSSQMVIWIVGFHREGKIGNTEKNHEAKMRPRTNQGYAWCRLWKSKQSQIYGR